MKIRKKQKFNKKKTVEAPSNPSLLKELRFVHSHPKELIINDPSKGITTRASTRNHLNNCAFISQIESKNFKEAEFKQE